MEDIGGPCLKEARAALDISQPSPRQQGLAAGEPANQTANIYHFPARHIHQGLKTGRKRIPGPAGAVLEAQQQGFRLLSISDAESRDGISSGRHVSASPSTATELDFVSEAWQDAVSRAGIESFDGKFIERVQPGIEARKSKALFAESLGLGLGFGGLPTSIWQHLFAKS